MPEKSLSSAGVRLLRLDYGSVLEALKSYAERVVAKGALLVVLVGSLARGDYTAYSDADVLVVLESSDKKPHERIPDFLDPTLPVDVDPFVYTLDEITRLAYEGSRIVQEAVERGVLLAGSESVFARIKDAFYARRNLRTNS